MQWASVIFFARPCAQLALAARIADITMCGRLPRTVAGTGFYLYFFLSDRSSLLVLNALLLLLPTPLSKERPPPASAMFSVCGKVAPNGRTKTCNFVYILYGLRPGRIWNGSVVWHKFMSMGTLVVGITRWASEQANQGLVETCQKRKRRRRKLHWCCERNKKLQGKILHLVLQPSSLRDIVSKCRPHYITERQIYQ